jgi:predicted DNA-binding ribbon-helix-helix protein
MLKQERRDDGKFAAKSAEIRQVRSIRLTDKAWENLGKLANLRSITRADLIEELTENDLFDNLPEVLNQAPLSNNEQEQEIKLLREQVDNLTQENQLLSRRIFTNLELIRDAVLFNLKFGKQAPGYKAAFKALNQFIKEIINSK